jgi:hypothetical protein
VRAASVTDLEDKSVLTSNLNPVIAFSLTMTFYMLLDTVAGLAKSVIQSVGRVGKA